MSRPFSHHNGISVLKKDLYMKQFPIIRNGTLRNNLPVKLGFKIQNFHEKNALENLARKIAAIM